MPNHHGAQDLGKPATSASAWSRQYRAEPGWSVCSVQPPVFTSISAALETGRALARVAGKSEVFVTGGSAVYAAALPFADRLYITEVETEMQGDARFPDFDEAQFHEITRRQVAASDKNEFAFTIRTLDRLAAPLSQ